VRELVRSGALRPLAAILLMHSAVTTAGYAVPVIAPAAAADMGLAPESVGFLVAAIYLAAMVTAPVSGVVIARTGPTRLFQVLLVVTAAGTALFAVSTALAAFAGALLIGCATGPLNPLGSHVLMRAAPQPWRAFVFSVKQCGTPAGGMIAGAALPPLTLAFGWQGAMLAIPLAACALLALAPLATRGITDAPAAGGGVLAAIARSLRGVLSDPALRRVALTGTSFAACQMAIGSYLVVYLWRVAEVSTEVAGLAFSAMHVAGIASRIALGAVADRQVSSQRLLAVLALLMGLSLALLTGVSSAWPVPALFAVTVAVGVSGNGWVGLFFSELARLAPPDRTAEIAGGGQSVMYAGIVAGPLLFGALLGWSGSYALCLWLFAGVSILSFAALLGAPPASRSG
jgi:predicted MFS family arabinose efflux permease